MIWSEEGVTHFTGGGDHGERELFRFVVAVNDEMLTIRLENRTTKCQWRTHDLRVADFVDPDAVIPQAKTRDYAQRFADCLRIDDDGSSSVYARAISGADKDGTRMLDLKIKLTFASFEAWIAYTFALVPVALESVDLLAAQVRDLQDEVNALKQHQRDAALARRAHAEFKALANAASGCMIKWSSVLGDLDPDWFAVKGEEDVVTICKGGSYLVCLTVAHCSSLTVPPVEVHINGQKVRDFVDATLQGKFRQASGSFLIQVEDDAQLSVKFQGNSSAYAMNTYLSLLEV